MYKQIPNPILKGLVSDTEHDFGGGGGGRSQNVTHIFYIYNSFYLIMWIISQWNNNDMCIRNICYHNWQYLLSLKFQQTQDFCETTTHADLGVGWGILLLF